MKKLSIMFILYIMAFIVCSCGKEKTKVPDFMEDEVEGFKINDEPMSSPKTLYSIADLKGYFDNQWGIFLDDINDRFAIEYLRKAPKGSDFGSYYIVYPVSEGGKFLVYLVYHVDFETNQKRLCSSDCLYINNLPNKKDFEQIDSSFTYDDIKRNAPCTHLVTVRSSSIVSYSPLADERVMMCIYEQTSGQTLKVVSHKVLDTDDNDYPYKGMVSGDLVP